jgi:hypothetical protein
MILLILYQICYAAWAGIRIIVIKAQYTEELFFVSFINAFFVSFPAIAFNIISVILISIGLKKVSDEKNPKIVAAKILAITLVINPILIDSIIEYLVTEEFYFLAKGIFLRDFSCIVNGVNLIAFMVLLLLIQRERKEKKRLKIKKIILPTIAVGLLMVWYIIAIYKQVKMNPVPEGLGIYDYYFDKIRISTNVIHILFAIIGFFMMLEFVIKDLTKRRKEKINIKR